MEPFNDHERTIARVVDQMSAEDRLDRSAMSEVIVSLDFIMSVSDSDFLINYLRWRTKNPTGNEPFQHTLGN
jgi:hypothetical protein